MRGTFEMHAHANSVVSTGDGLRHSGGMTRISAGLTAE